MPSTREIYGYPESDWKLFRELREVALLLKEHKLQGAPPSRIILYVEDLDESVAFYTAVLGMTLFRKRSNVNSIPKDASMVAHVVR